MDEQRYGALLAEVRPRIIETAEEHERLLGLAESMMEKGDDLAEEEEKILALIVLLIEAYDLNVGDEDDGSDDREEVPAPHITLQRLMYSHDVKLDDVAHLFGNPHLAREVLDGKREISKRQAKELGKFFRVPAKLFSPNA
jgi:HTH-type transcriptional regulator / antitoxin HigA